VTKCLTIDRLTGGDITKVKEGRNSKNWFINSERQKLKQLDGEDRKYIEKREQKNTSI